MSAPKVDFKAFGLPLQDYPEGVIADEIERQLALTLPPIAGLSPEMSVGQRTAVFDKAIARERAAFVQMHGDPFGGVEDVSLGVVQPPALLLLAA